MSRSAARLRLCLILVLACALYAPSLANRFALDDRLVAMAVRDDGTPNRMVAELQPLGRYFTTNYWQGFLDRDILYRPTTTLSYALVYAGLGRHLGGEAGEALPQHALNLLLHLVAVWLVYRLVRAARVPRSPSLLAALVFAVHAIHSEVVAGVVGRAELLAFGAGAAATLGFVRLERGGMAARLGRGLGVAVALFLAMTAKESAVAWVPFLPLFVVVRHLRAAPDLRLGPTLARVLVSLALVAALPLVAFFSLRAATIAGLGADAQTWGEALERATPGSPRANALVQWTYALGACLLPVHLSADWGPLVFSPVASVRSPSALASILVLGAVLAAALLGWRRRPLLLLAAAAWFGHGFLTSNVPFRIGTDYAERLYYAPSLGVAVAAAWVAMRWRSWPRRASMAWASLVCAWVAWNGWLVLQRNPVWRDNDSLHRHEVVHQPRSIRMRLQWASQLERAGQPEAARPHLEAALDLLPESAAAWNHLGTVHARAGRAAEARRCFERGVAALDFTPDVRVAAAVNLARACLLAGDGDGVVRALELALQTDARVASSRVPELRQLFAGKVQYGWFDDFLQRLQRAAPTARVWPYERAWWASAADQPRAALAWARQALGEGAAAGPSPGLGPPERAEMQMVVATSALAIGEREAARQAAAAVAADENAPPALREQARGVIERAR
ncbi:MAG: tetratricopeptide repeat protein [Planctomycetota bacterium]